jgi:hypothetical protein
MAISRVSSGPELECVWSRPWSDTIPRMADNTERRFDALVQKEGRFTFIAIPFSPRDAWGAKPRYHVTGSINGIPVRGCLGALKRDYFLRLGAAWLRDCAIAPGEMVQVRLMPEGPQDENMAADVTKALSGNKQAKTFFEGLPTFYRKNFIRWIESAKREETRAKRIAEMMTLLAAGKRGK